MFKIRKANERGNIKIYNWLDSYHSFSFGDYQDPNFVSFNSLRAINEDFIKASSGFKPHSHQNMEIMTYIISGELAHKDNMGNSSIIKSGEVQFMRAGTNVTHSEFNPSDTNDTHSLQIWLYPNKNDLKPTYSQKLYLLEDKLDKLCILAQPDVKDGTFQIAQNVVIYCSILSENKIIEYKIKQNNDVWLQIISGILEINNVICEPGDGVAITNETCLVISAKNTSEFLLFDFIKG